MCVLLQVRDHKEAAEIGKTDWGYTLTPTQCQHYNAQTLLIIATRSEYFLDGATLVLVAISEEQFRREERLDVVYLDVICLRRKSANIATQSTALTLFSSSESGIWTSSGSSKCIARNLRTRSLTSWPRRKASNSSESLAWWTYLRRPLGVTC